MILPRVIRTHARVINDFCPKSSEGTQDFDDPGRVSVIDAEKSYLLVYSILPTMRVGADVCTVSSIFLI